MPETHQIKIFSGEILTFLKPASPGRWWAAPPILGLAAQRRHLVICRCNLEIFISGIIRGQGKAIHRPGVSCNQIAGGSFKPSHHWRCLGKRRKWLVSDDGDDDHVDADDDGDDDDDDGDDDNDGHEAGHYEL